jgi:cob(I)alamin adenosyltransferase
VARAAIDALNDDLAPLTSFILPGGSEAAAAGSIRPRRGAARRAGGGGLAGAEPVNPAALATSTACPYYLFVLARLRSTPPARVTSLWVPWR